MFDDEAAQPTKPPTNLPVEPVDMFAGVEREASAPNKIPDALSNGLLKKKETVEAPIKQMENVVPMAKTSSGGGKKIMLIVGLLLLVGLGGFGVWYFVVNGMPESAPKAADVVQPQPIVPDNTTPIETAEKVITDTPVVPAIDTDQDGLDDQKEAQLGTDPKEPDTDTDALSDGDEVLVWKTNPLSPDTDGDGYLDGTEIKNGYSPTGPGKLFPIGGPSATATSSSAGGTTVTP